MNGYVRTVANDGMVNRFSRRAVRSPAHAANTLKYAEQSPFTCINAATGCKIWGLFHVRAFTDDAAVFPNGRLTQSKQPLRSDILVRSVPSSLKTAAVVSAKKQPRLGCGRVTLKTSRKSRKHKKWILVLISGGTSLFLPISPSTTSLHACCLIPRANSSSHS